MAGFPEDPVSFEFPPSDVKDRPLWHVTTRKNCASISARKAVVPLNWIIEGTQGQEKDESVLNIGLDAMREESDHVSPEQHQAEVERKLKFCEEQSRTYPDYKENFWPHYWSAKQGRKRDFVYCTQDKTMVFSYRGQYLDKNIATKKDLFVLRWSKQDEDYFKDKEDRIEDQVSLSGRSH